MKNVRGSVIYLAFILLSTLAVRYFVPAETDLPTIAAGVLPIVCYVLVLYVMQFTQLVSFLFQLLSWPLRLLFGIGRKRKKETEAPGSDRRSRSFGLSAIFICGLLYALVGRFVLPSGEGIGTWGAFCLLGLICGYLLYAGYQSGEIEEMESEF